ncbi:hypothetical protein BDV12DRAFT_199454 [Aspergillus spectabilis]
MASSHPSSRPPSDTGDIDPEHLMVPDSDMPQKATYWPPSVEVSVNPRGTWSPGWKNMSMLSLRVPSAADEFNSTDTAPRAVEQISSKRSSRALLAAGSPTPRETALHSASGILAHSSRVPSVAGSGNPGETGSHSSKHTPRRSLRVPSGAACASLREAKPPSPKEIPRRSSRAASVTGVDYPTETGHNGSRASSSRRSSSTSSGTYSTEKPSDASPTSFGSVTLPDPVDFSRTPSVRSMAPADAPYTFSYTSRLASIPDSRRSFVSSTGSGSETPVHAHDESELSIYIPRMSDVPGELDETDPSLLIHPAFRKDRSSRDEPRRGSFLLYPEGPTSAPRREPTPKEHVCTTKPKMCSKCLKARRKVSSSVAGNIFNYTHGTQPVIVSCTFTGTMNDAFDYTKQFTKKIKGLFNGNVEVYAAARRAKGQHSSGNWYDVTSLEPFKAHYTGSPWEILDHLFSWGWMKKNKDPRRKAFKNKERKRDLEFLVNVPFHCGPREALRWVFERSLPRDLDLEQIFYHPEHHALRRQKWWKRTHPMEPRRELSSHRCRRR